MSIVVVATAEPREGCRDEVIAAFERVIPQVHRQSGCERYALHEAGDRLVMVERWADQAAIDRHLSGAPFAELSSALEASLVRPLEVMVLAPRPAGTPAKGQI